MYTYLEIFNLKLICTNMSNYFESLEKNELSEANPIILKKITTKNYFPMLCL